MKKKKNKNTNYYIDTVKYSSGVIETLEEKGGINSNEYDPKDIHKNCIYFIDPITKNIQCCIKENNIISNIITTFYTEIAPNRRLSKGTTYYYAFISITSMNFEIGKTADNYTRFDDKLFESGNYFKTKDDAQVALDKIKAIFNDNK